jgi:DNA-binding MarR family transcriptional regulator
MAKPPPSCASASSAKSAPNPALTQNDKRAIQALLSALEPLINLRGSLPLPFVTTFLTVALDEGKGVNEYARVVGIHRAAMSRYLRDIGDRARYGGPGLGLVKIDPHPTDSVRKQVFLNTKGRSIAKNIFRQLRRLSDGEHNAPRGSRRTSA